MDLNVEDSVVKKEDTTEHDPLSCANNIKVEQDPLEDITTQIKKEKIEDEDIAIKEEPETAMKETIKETVECDICEERFTNNVELDAHVRIHF